jgi:hypothetical protein
VVQIQWIVEKLVVDLHASIWKLAVGISRNVFVPARQAKKRDRGPCSPSALQVWVQSHISKLHQISHISYLRLSGQLRLHRHFHQAFTPPAAGLQRFLGHCPVGAATAGPALHRFFSHFIFCFFWKRSQVVARNFLKDSGCGPPSQLPPQAGALCSRWVL